MNTTLPDPPLPDPDGDVLVSDDPDTADAGGGPSRSRRLGDRMSDLVERREDGIVGGVAVELADRLGVDVLWMRLGFVVLLLLGGIGGLLYVGLWLGLIVGRDRPWARVAGGVTVFALPVIIANAQPSIATGTGAVVILLVGLTLALWNRNAPTAPPVAPAARAAGFDPPSVAPVEVPAAPTLSASPRHTRRERVHRQRRPPSVLGRATLGVAIVVGAVGALIDELNGGRTHPEQWLGVAAGACGVGLLVGAFRGHARWLVLPAVAFAGVGYLAGELAQVGLRLTDVGGDEYATVFDGPGGYTLTTRSALGSTYLDVGAVPSERVDVEVLSAFGDVQISATDEATIELIANIDDGQVWIGGRSVGGGTHRVGPEGDPDVVIDARVAHGDINIWTYDTTPVPEFETPNEELIAPGDGRVIDIDPTPRLSPFPTVPTEPGISVTTALPQEG